MKLFKPSYAYGAKQSSFSKYEHHEQMSQSNYALDAKPSYDAQVHDHVHGQPMGGFDANESHHARSENSFNYNAQAQSALPSPPIQVQQGRPMDGMMKNRGHMGNEWASNSPKYAYPAHVDDSRLGMQNEKHMMGEMGHDWGNKPNQYSSPTQTHHFGEAGYKGQGQKAYNRGENGIEGGWGNKPNGYSNPAQTHNFGESRYGHEKQPYNYGGNQFDNTFSSPKYLSPIKTNRPNVVKHKEDYGRPNSAPNFSSPTHAPRSGLSMDKDEYSMGPMDHGWANSPTKFSSPSHAQHSSLGMQKDGHLMGKMGHGWANSPTKLSGLAQGHQSAPTMQNNNEYMMEKRDHGWGRRSPNKFANSTQTHDYDYGEMDRGWDNSPTKFYNPTQAHQSSRGIHNEEHMTGNMNRGWTNSSPTKYSGPNHFNNSSNHNEHAQRGWGQNSNNGFGPNGPNQANYSAHRSYDEHDQYVDDDVHDIMDEILTKYPAQKIGSGPEDRWAAKPNSYAGPNKFAGYAKQAIGGLAHLAHYGGAVQSMNKTSAKFALTKENNSNAGYSSNYGKEEHSASSNSKKYEAKFTLDRGLYS